MPITLEEVSAFTLPDLVGVLCLCTLVNVAVSVVGLVVYLMASEG
jgi:hypothetical protein